MTDRTSGAGAGSPPVQLWSVVTAAALVVLLLLVSNPVAAVLAIALTTLGAVLWWLAGRVLRRRG